MKRIFRENGLSIVWLGLFFVTFIVGQTISGQLEYNEDQRNHGKPEVSYTEYLRTPHFFEATMENWESEFFADVFVRRAHRISISKGVC